MITQSEIQNPFQSGAIESLDYFSGILFSNDRASEYEAFYFDIKNAFNSLMKGGSTLEFVHNYEDSIRTVFGEMLDLPNLEKAILREALSSLLNISVLLKARRKPALIDAASIKTWQLESGLLQGAYAYLQGLRDNGELERSGVTTYAYNLKRDKALFNWVKEVLRPIIFEYVGEGAMPVAHIRTANSTNADLRDGRYLHPFANYHWDAAPFSFPLIIYLDAVFEDDGPFTYVKDSDKISQDYVLRAIHSAVSQCIHTDAVTDRQLVATLPALLRYSDRVGLFTGQELFSRFSVEHVVRPKGAAVLFDGFHLVHDGGLPKAGGSRCALFVNFRFPRQKVRRLMAKLAEKYLVARNGKFLT